ncbi:MAG: FkbM family methyltransferase [Fimbriimonadaceae bacterium]|jgi:FkbM family methyltransferase|nr:FkbM family methyltransferase [Fimbriimonadaceae bacterium]
MVASDAQIVFDIGAHTGEDTDFYLRKGFKVVAVEADPDLAEALKRKFADPLTRGQLVVEAKAMFNEPGQTITLFKNTEISAWNTINPTFRDRNLNVHGKPSIEIQVETTTLARLVELHGKPYMVKIDIEGEDVNCLRQVKELKPVDRPQFASIECDIESLEGFEAELQAFLAGGFTQFALIPQHEVHNQVPPKPAKEGREIDYQFQKGASGLFGLEIPAKWVSKDEILAEYRQAWKNIALNGNKGTLNRWAPVAIRKYVRGAFNVLGFKAGWYDLHGRRP